MPSEQINNESTTKIFFMSISAWKRYNSHMNQNEIARRSFLTATAITAASYSRVLGANDTIQLGVIGAGDRGTYVMSNFQKNSSVHGSALCELYTEHIDHARPNAPHAKRF